MIDIYMLDTNHDFKVIILIKGYILLGIYFMKIFCVVFYFAVVLSVRILRAMNIENKSKFYIL